VLRGSDLTRLMVTLAVALVLREIANALPQCTGGADGLQGMSVGRCSAASTSTSIGRTAYAYSLTTLFVLFLLARRVVHSPFGLSLMAIRRNPLRAAALGVPVPPPDRGSTRSPPPMPVRPARCSPRRPPSSRSSASSSTLGRLLLLLIIGGAGWLYGGIAGAVVYKILQDGFARCAAVLDVLDRAVPGRLRLVGRER
jgi:branched-chain amino acid transport system permease protein